MGSRRPVRDSLGDPAPESDPRARGPVDRRLTDRRRGLLERRAMLESFIDTVASWSSLVDPFECQRLTP